MRTRSFFSRLSLDPCVVRCGPFRPAPGRIASFVPAAGARTAFRARAVTAQRNQAAWSYGGPGCRPGEAKGGNGKCKT